MSAKVRIFDRLAKPAPVNPTAGWQAENLETDLKNRFAEALTAAHGKVFLEADLDAALNRLGQIFRENGVRTAAWNVQTPLQEINLQATFPEISWRRSPAEPAQQPESLAEWHQYLAGCDLGLTGAAALLSETGTVVLETGRENSRLVSLLPPVHAVLAPTHLLKAGIFDWIVGRGNRWPANVVLISGPSKTGDIEQTLSVGVHGPKQIFVILYEEEA